MDDEQVIREKMEETRTSLSEKLETLENKVVDTVKEATEAVSDTVGTVKETVEETVSTVKGSVESAVGTVKGAVTDSVETVKDWLDVSTHVQNHPWLAMAGAVAAGYCLETMLEPRSPEAPHRETYTSPAPQRPFASPSRKQGQRDAQRAAARNQPIERPGSGCCARRRARNDRAGRSARHGAASQGSDRQRHQEARRRTARRRFIPFPA